MQEYALVAVFDGAVLSTACRTSLIALQGASWLLGVTNTSNGSFTLELSVAQQDNKSNAQRVKIAVSSIANVKQERSSSVLGFADRLPLVLDVCRGAIWKAGDRGTGHWAWCVPGHDFGVRAVSM